MTPQNIPINGRIAIVDDQIEQIYPIIKLFGKLRIPYVYYGTDSKALPPKDSAQNDVRILILDINLLGDQKRPVAELKSLLVPIVDRIISDHNYPYLLLYWSRHEGEYDSLVEEIFKKDLPTKAPISYLSLRKSDFVSDDGQVIEDEEQPDLLEIIRNELRKFPIYEHLLNWENQIHVSADKTLEEIFKLKTFGADWNKDSSNVFYKLAVAYSGKQLAETDALGQVKSAFYYSLNSVFTDSLEYSIGTFVNDGCGTLDKPSSSNDIIYALNKKLLLSEDTTPINKPGVLIQSLSKAKTRTSEFNGLLNDCLNRQTLVPKFKRAIKRKEKGLTEPQLKKKIEKRYSDFKGEIKNSLLNVFLVVTPLCDYAQKKFVYNKIVSGIIIDAKYIDDINRSSEAIYVSPIITVGETKRILILDLRHLSSVRRLESKNFKPLFRVRQQLLAEIQSKLARHLNRQGVLFLD